MNAKDKVAALAHTITDRLGSGMRNFHVDTHDQPTTMRIYSRLTLITLPESDGSIAYIPAVVVASVDVAESYRRTGLWTHFIGVLTETCRQRGRAVLVENVLNDGFLEFFENSEDWHNLSDTGLSQYTEPNPSSFIYGLDSAERSTYEDRMGYVFNKIA